MRIGITEPKYAVLDDGTQAVVKLSHGPEGNLVLFNEYVCYRLAILLDIPMPHCGICVMDEKTEVFNPDIASGDNYGYAFYSTYLLVGFYKDNISLNVIDHSHVFINGAIWDSGCLKIAMKENDLLSIEVLKNNERLYGMFFRNISITKAALEQASMDFKNKITGDVIKKFIRECPHEWRPVKENEDVLVEYIMYRIDHFDVIISTILNYIK